jgi:hypothetical protein
MTSADGSNLPVIQADGFMVIVIGPLGFHRYASQFLVAAKSLPPEPKFSPVPYYLLCRSIELGLKAYLLCRRIDPKVLKQPPLGHNLLAILARSEVEGIGSVFVISQEERAELAKANEYYVEKGFEYFHLLKNADGYKGLPALRSRLSRGDLLTRCTPFA